MGSLRAPRPARVVSALRRAVGQPGRTEPLSAASRHTTPPRAWRRRVRGGDQVCRARPLQGARRRPAAHAGRDASRDGVPRHLRAHKIHVHAGAAALQTLRRAAAARRRPAAAAAAAHPPRRRPPAAPPGSAAAAPARRLQVCVRAFFTFTSSCMLVAYCVAMWYADPRLEPWGSRRAPKAPLTRWGRHVSGQLARQARARAAVDVDAARAPRRAQ